MCNRPGKDKYRNFSRRRFLQICTVSPVLVSASGFGEKYTYTVKGKVRTADLGASLIHEHVLVDFIGADKITTDRWNHDEVIKKVLPYLIEAKRLGIRSIMECTPAFIGRDVRLLQKLSEQSGLHILTNAGYYGASDNKYLPSWAFTETAGQLSQRWIAEFERGIDGTGIKPGFIKTGVNAGALSPLHQKLITAAALTHLRTGLTICSHTGPALPANEEIEILRKTGVSPKAFVWVHANGSRDEIVNTAKSGCWISLDGVGDDNLFHHAELIVFLKSKGLLSQVLVSHDAGWYRPGESGGGEFRGFTTISDKLIPLLKAKGLDEGDLETLLIANPAKAFAISVRKG
jgi:phosphotriesterase-related protein